MRADLLTKNQDEKYGHFSSDTDDIREREANASGQGSSIYNGTKLRGSEADSERGRSEVDSAVLRDSENHGNFVKKIDPPVVYNDKPAKLRQLLTSKKLRGKSSLLTVIVLLFGGGGFLSTLLAPSAAIIQLKEVFTQSLNDQLKAVDSRSASIMRAKFKSTTTGSCGVIKIKCDFAKMSENQARAFEARDKRFKIELADVSDGKGKIGKITFTDDGKPPVEITDAKQFSGLLNENQAFRSAWGSIYSVPFESVSDPKAREVIRDREKATKNVALTGENDEERQKKLNQVATTGETIDTKNIVKNTDKNGNTTYTDENGRTYTQAQYDEAVKSGDRISQITKAGGQNSIINNNLSRAFTADMVGENVCTTYNFMRHVSAMAKLVKKQQAIRFALALVLTMADKIKAGDATEDEVNFAGNNIMKAQPDKKVVDDSKLSTASDGSIPLASDPEAGATGLDAPSYRMAAYGDVPTLSSRAAKFTLTGGSVAVIDSITTNVARVVNGGNPDPKQVSKKCGYIQSPLVRVGALGLGIVAGVMTFGTWQIAGMAASVGFSLAQPSLEAAAGDMAAGNAFTDLFGIDSVDATYVGTAGVTGDIGEGRGMLPVTGEEGIEYINGNKQVLNTYIQDQRYMARITPFDLSNRYSFFGSMLFSVTPALLKSRASTSSAMLQMASLIPTTFASIMQPAKAMAAQNSYFNSCPDPMYKAMGIKAGPFCEVRHYMPANSLNLDPLENAQWMSDTGNIDPNSDIGSATDNGQDWNYVKYLAECANRTVGWGENQEENSGDGSDCFKPEYEPLNMHFRAYTMDLSINNGMKDGNTNTTPSGGDKGIIALDPGHSVQDINDRDATTGAILSDYPNGKEVDDVWDVAMRVKAKLEQEGYTVKMLRNSKDERVNFQERAERAKGSQLVISIHTTPSGGSQVGAQFVGGYRSANGKTLEFQNASTAAKSQMYAQAMATARTEKEGTTVDVRNFNFDGRGGDIASGNLPWVQLLSPDTPWIYNEIEPTDGGGGVYGISEAAKNKYVDGIVAGIEASGITKDTTPSTGTAISARIYNPIVSLQNFFGTVFRMIHGGKA